MYMIVMINLLTDLILLVTNTYDFICLLQSYKKK